MRRWAMLSYRSTGEFVSTRKKCLGKTRSVRQAHSNLAPVSSDVCVNVKILNDEQLTLVQIQYWVDFSFVFKDSYPSKFSIPLMLKSRNDCYARQKDKSEENQRDLVTCKHYPIPLSALSFQNAIAMFQKLAM